MLVVYDKGDSGWTIDVGLIQHGNCEYIPVRLRLVNTFESDNCSNAILFVDEQSKYRSVM